MKIIRFVIIFLSASALLTACNGRKNDESTLVTKRIQYDVTIRNSDPDFDWWVQNVEGSNRENLVKDILNRVVEGNIITYDFFSYKQFSKEEVQRILKKIDTISVERSTPPYDLVDTVLIKEIRIQDITKLRFMEEWYIDKSTLVFTKKVIGLCPLAEVYTETGELRGFKPLFWIFFDEKYPGELKLK